MIYYYCMMIILIVIFRLIMLCGLHYGSFMLAHVLWVTLHLCVSGYSCHDIALLNVIFTLFLTVLKKIYFMVSLSMDFSTKVDMSGMLVKFFRQHFKRWQQ